MTNDQQIIIGRFGKAFGVKGWIKVISFTEPEDNILSYSPWLIKEPPQSITIDDSKINQHIVVKIAGIDDRETAKTFTNLDILLPAQQLPKLTKDKYYWHELEGLAVINQDEKNLGKVDHILATGANDVLVVIGGKRENQHLIPYTNDAIIKINIKNKTIKVNWPDEI